MSAVLLYFDLPRESHVVLKLYNMIGQEVMTVLDENKVAGRYDVQIDGSTLSSGVYFYKLSVVNYFATKKMLLLK